jgi:hypothetical protein
MAGCRRNNATVRHGYELWLHAVPALLMLCDNLFVTQSSSSSSTAVAAVSGAANARLALLLLAALLLAHVLCDTVRIHLLGAYCVAMHCVTRLTLNAQLLQLLLFTTKNNNSNNNSIVIIGSHLEPMSWITVALLHLVLLASALLSSWLMPMARLPAPTGPYQRVGVVEFRTPSADAHGNDIVCKLYYPAATSDCGSEGGVRARFTTSAVGMSIGRFAKLPAALFAHLAGMHSHAIVNAKPLQQQQKQKQQKRKLPVLVYSHGLGGHADIYSVIPVDLASHGFCVLVPTHTDHSASVAMQGEEKPLLVMRMLTKQEDRNIATQIALRNGQLQTRVRNLQTVLDVLTRWQRSSSSSGSKPQHRVQSQHHMVRLQEIVPQLELQRVGAIGHRFGGATVTALGARDARSQAGVAHDTWMLPLAPYRDTSFAGFNRAPLLTIVSQHFEDWVQNHACMLSMFARAHAQSRLLTLKGSRHQNFCDVCLCFETLSRHLNAIGGIDVRHAFSVLNTYDVAFFKLHMKLLGSDDDSERAACRALFQQRQDPEMRFHARPHIDAADMHNTSVNGSSSGSGCERKED